MDSPGSTISSLGKEEASQLLKDILNVGGPRNNSASGTGSDISTVSLGSNAKELLGTHSSHSGGDGEPHGIPSQPPDTRNGSASIQELLKTITLGKSGPTRQQILLEGDDGKNSFSVYGQEVDIIASEGSGTSQPTPGSNKVKINPVVNFDWEHKHYFGNLVAVHRNGIHVAYSLRGKSGGIVRIINRKTAQRALLKGFTGLVNDIAFAHLTAVILGGVDEMGNLFIYEIFEGADGKIDTTLMLQVTRMEEVSSDNHRLIWCPYIPEEEDSSNTTNTTGDSSLVEDVGKLLVVTHDDVAEMWNIEMVTKEYGCGPLLPSEVEVGYLIVDSHQKGTGAPIVDASFSPDGTALATASLDGDVKFFQVYLHDKSPPRCLHQWQPHNGEPVTSLFFMDDHKHPNPDIQFWKFAITGASNNREIKVWSCESWTCLQTIRFSPSLGLSSSFSAEPCLKAAMDLSANYLILSDVSRKVLYTLELFQDPEAGRAHVSSISEFLLAQPCLSFAILDASRRKFARSPESGHDRDVSELTTGEVGGDEEEEVSPDIDGPDVGTLVKMYAVHTRVLQELQIRFRPESSVPQPPPASISSISQDESALRDPLSDISVDPSHSDSVDPRSDRSNGSLSDRSLVSERSGVSHGSRVSEGHTSVHSGQGTPTSTVPPMLMTPDAFTSPRKEQGAHAQDSLRSSGSSQHSSFTQVTAFDENDPLRTPLASVQLPPTIPSPGSSITLTPASSKEFPSDVGTPSSVPLPPSTPGEDGALLLTPGRGPPTQAPLPPTPGSPPAPTLFPMPPSAISQDFLTSSPASHKPHDFKPPLSSCSHSGGSGAGSSVSGDALDDMFTRRGTQRHKLQSTGSSSSTSLEVSEILEGAKRAGQDMTFDENEGEDSRECPEGEEGPEEEEVEEEEVEEEEEDSEREQDDVEVKEEADEEDAADDSPPHQGYDQRIWPKAPDVEEVNMEAQRLASEAIERAAALHTQASDENIQSEGSGQMGEEQADDDVQIEEEKEEIVEDEEKPPSDREVAPPVHPSGSRPPPPAAQIVYQGMDPGAVTQLQSSVQQMLGLLTNQQAEIEHLRAELEMQRHSASVVGSLQSQIDKLEGALSKKVAGALDQHSVTETQRLERALGERESMEKQKHERLVSTLSKTLENSLANKIDRTIKDEVRQHVIPTVTRSLEPLKTSLHTEMAQKLTATDALMKENISKLVRSRQTYEAIGSAAATALQGPIQAACRDVVVPSMDRACQSVFQQVNQTFQRGSQEYIQQLEAHMELVRRRHEEARDPIVHQLQAVLDSYQRREEERAPLYKSLAGLGDSLHATTQQLQESNSQLEAKILTSIENIQESMIGQVKRLVQDEVLVAIRDQQANLNEQLLTAMRSGAITPSPVPPDPQQLKSQVLQLLRQGQLNAAFQQALQASDLSLVMFVCETVNPTQVFQQSPCPLHQPVLLSLIQQLSAELNSNLELKHKYLEEAVMNLDQTHGVTREHMPAVLGQLCQKLSAFIQANPQDKMTRSIKMLLMATQSLLR